MRQELPCLREAEGHSGGFEVLHVVRTLQVLTGRAMRDARQDRQAGRWVGRQGMEEGVESEQQIRCQPLRQGRVG